MAKRKKPATATYDLIAIVKEISNRLDSVEELLAWCIRADQRFRKGQRVQFSPYADRRNISACRKNGVRTGTVHRVDGFIIDVLLDGYKKPMGFHHSFFEAVGTRK